MFPRFFSHLTISLSQALGQRTAERLKVSSTFSKVAGCGTASHGLGVARGAGLACRLGRRWTVPTGHQRPCLPLLPKMGGRMSPSWGGTEPGGGTVLAENLRRAYGSVREPPTRVPCEKTSAGSLFYPPAFAGGEEGRGTLSHTLPPLKRWAKLLLVSPKPERGHKS